MKLFDESILTEVIAEDGLGSASRPAMRESLQNDDGSSARPASREQIESEVAALLREHAGSLARYAATIARTRTVVQDGVQEAFLRLFAARIEGQQIDNPRAWLFRVLRNYILDCNRRSGGMPEVDLEAADRVIDSRQDLERMYHRNEVFERVLVSLSQRERECFLLRLEGFGYEDIARILKIRVGTVGALVTRGLKKIRHLGFLSRKIR